MILTPLVGAFIGWVTNLIAVKMLFRPLRPLRVLGLTLQGLIPRRRTEIAATVARTVERDLLSPGEISAVLHRLDWEGEVSRAVDEIVERRAGALRTLPFAETVLEPLKEALARNLLKEVEERRGGLVDRFRERLDLQEMVVRRLDQYDLAALEALVLKVASRELSAIVWLGALLGFLVGLAQVGLLALLG
jgi:uncharacterized membrane protein YheB (UPF0754 family)